MTAQHLSTQIRLILRNFVFTVTSLLIFRPMCAMTANASDTASDAVICINTMFLGDIVLAAEFLKRLSESGRFKRHILVVREEYARLCLKIFPLWDVVAVTMWKYRLNPAYRYAVLQHIRRQQAAVAINISAERGVINDELTTLGGTKERIAGHAGGRYLLPLYTLIDNLFYTSLFRSAEKNEYRRLLEMLPQLTGSINENDSKQSTTIVESVNAKGGANNGIPFVIVAPLAQHGEKGWALERYRELCMRLSEKIDVLVIGSPEQNKLLAPFDNGSSVRVIAGETKLEDLPQYLCGCELFIGNDSGVTHLAHALNVQTLAIVGGGAWGTFFPYGRTGNIRYLFHQMDCFGCNWNCRYPIKYCLSEISTADVYDAAVGMLNHQIPGKR